MAPMVNCLKCMHLYLDFDDFDSDEFFLGVNKMGRWKLAASERLGESSWEYFFYLEITCCSQKRGGGSSKSNRFFHWKFRYFRKFSDRPTFRSDSLASNL